MSDASASHTTRALAERLVSQSLSDDAKLDKHKETVAFAQEVDSETKLVLGKQGASSLADAQRLEEAKEAQQNEAQRRFQEKLNKQQAAHARTGFGQIGRTFSTLHLSKEEVAASRLAAPVVASASSESINKPSRFEKDSIRVSENTGIDRDQMEVFSLDFSADGRFLACACSNGTVRIYNKMKALHHTLPAAASRLPVTCVRVQPGTSQGPKSTLIVAGADGTLAHWHMTSTKPWYTTEEKGNQIYTCAYRADGLRFATAGKDSSVRIYEDSTKQMLMKMDDGHSSDAPGHSNRVYATCWSEHTRDVLLTGGWDNSIQVWDLRIGKSVRSIYGPHICGDALDLDNKGRILAGSWRPSEGLELYDLGSGKKLQTVDWTKGSSIGQADHIPEMIYSAKFSHDGSMIAAGGSGQSVAKVFDSASGEELYQVGIGAKHKVYDVAWAPNDSKVAFGGSGELLHLLTASSR